MAAAPWSLRVRDRAPLTLVAVVRGQAWIVPDDADPQALGPGDVALIRGPGHYTVADDPATAPVVMIDPGQVCTTLDGAGLAEAMHLGVRSWGNSAHGSTVMLTGTYQHEGEIGRKLVDALPIVVVVRRRDWDSPLVDLLADEIVADGPGQAAVLDRLLDLLLLSALRQWFSTPRSSPPSWFGAHGDPVVGKALRLMQHHPAHPWTVANLAAEVAVSRATLARRFHDLVGEPPVAFLTRWRLALAADLLVEPGATVGRVASQVGYGSPFALSTAFKRAYGVSPVQHRQRHDPARPAPAAAG